MLDKACEIGFSVSTVISLKGHNIILFNLSENVDNTSVLQVIEGIRLKISKFSSPLYFVNYYLIYYFIYTYVEPSPSSSF